MSHMLGLLMAQIRKSPCLQAISWEAEPALSRGSVQPENVL